MLKDDVVIQPTNDLFITVRNMKQEGFDTTVIAKITCLPLAEIEQLN